MNLVGALLRIPITHEDVGQKLFFLARHSVYFLMNFQKRIPTE